MTKNDTEYTCDRPVTHCELNLAMMGLQEAWRKDMANAIATGLTTQDSSVIGKINEIIGKVNEMIHVLQDDGDKDEEVNALQEDSH